MAGQSVTRSDLDFAASTAIVSLREAMDQVKTIDFFLSTQKADAPGGDPLTKSQAEGGFGYTEDEAYLLRVLFGALSSGDLTNLYQNGRLLTGLL